MQIVLVSKDIPAPTAPKVDELVITKKTLTAEPNIMDLKNLLSPDIDSRPRLPQRTANEPKSGTNENIRIRNASEL